MSTNKNNSEYRFQCFFGNICYRINIFFGFRFFICLCSVFRGKNLKNTNALSNIDTALYFIYRLNRWMVTFILRLHISIFYGKNFADNCVLISVVCFSFEFLLNCFDLVEYC